MSAPTLRCDLDREQRFLQATPPGWAECALRRSTAGEREHNAPARRLLTHIEWAGTL
jgi:hypothetical protein